MCGLKGHCYITGFSLDQAVPYMLSCSSRIEVAYQEAVALRRQEELIREEEEAEQAELELKAKRNAADKEKRTKKKQVTVYICTKLISGPQFC